MKWGAAIGGGALAALVSLSVASPLRAADLTPHPVPANPGYIPAQFFWTGFYMGASIGGGWGSTTFTDPFALATGSPSISGFLAGGLSGLNYQIGSFVFGAEGDFIGSWVKGSAVDSVGNNLQVSVFWTASLTGRFGVAFDRLLIYGKGGAGFDYERDTANSTQFGPLFGSFYRVGWTVGGGAEYAFTDHWTTRLEYDFFKFPVRGNTFSGLNNNGAGGNVGLDLNEIKGTVAYKF